MRRTRVMQLEFMLMRKTKTLVNTQGISYTLSLNFCIMDETCKNCFSKNDFIEISFEKKKQIYCLKSDFLNPQLISDTLPIQNQFLKLKKQFK